MDFKTLLKGGGIALSAVIAALYICGWQYYLSLFHTLELDMHFFIPIQIGIGGGVEPVTTMLFMPGFIAALAGLAAAKYAQRGKYALLLLRLVPIVIALLLPSYIKHAAGTWMGISLGWIHKIELSLLGVLLSYSLFTLVFNYERGERGRYRWYVLSVVFLLLASALYGNIRGESAANAVAAEKLAQITVSDEKLEQSFPGQLFAPLLEIDDYMIFCRFAPQEIGQPSESSRYTHKLSNGHIVFVKKSLIKEIEFKK